MDFTHVELMPVMEHSSYGSWGYHPEWNSYIIKYWRNEVRAFLTSGALFWLDKYHIDGLRGQGNRARSPLLDILRQVLALRCQMHLQRRVIFLKQLI